MIMSKVFVIFDQFIDEIVKSRATIKRADKSVKSPILFTGADEEGGDPQVKG